MEILKKLDHPNILKFIDVIETKQYTNIIFEFVENGSLKDIVAKFGNFPESLAVSILSLPIFDFNKIIFLITSYY